MNSGVRSFLRSVNRSNLFVNRSTTTTTVVNGVKSSSSSSSSSTINCKSFSQYSSTKSVPVVASSSTSLKPNSSTTSSILSIRSRVTRNGMSVMELLAIAGSDDDDGV
ncbi:hypothetical protein PPL_07629 [Heterostelium album PN500]|uniref:Uncharacterized protein n=1 Tax=Heterostelium pallidum (strain ATCC 26659 / Pp 5 / PN500) TaxID=670386 RepID=D3BGH8_HETP5|nr:hypothetical protein PPL_07629 [Heterostelium album PN500]EFA79578.1 hypothetical protein PPL_07629 [Heterostelium album PN500]|eukprot:XP_020431699.1 hypothetical protein PPL_07629 [Heterostelium album PN500]